MLEEEKTQEAEDKGSEVIEGEETEESEFDKAWKEDDEADDKKASKSDDKGKDKSDDADKDADKGDEGKDADKEKKEEDKDEDVDKDKGKEKEKEESDKKDEDAEKKEEEVKEKSSKDIVDEAAEKLAKRLKDEGKDTDKGEKEEEKSKSVQRRLEAQKKDEKQKEPGEFDVREFIKDVITEDEQAYDADLPEHLDLMGKVAQKLYTVMSKEFNGVITTMRNEHRDEIDNLVGESILTKGVPEWEKIVFEGDKVDKDENRVLNKEFDGWLDKQPELWKALFYKGSWNDNVKIIKQYKKEAAKKNLTEKDKKKEEDAKKHKDKFANTPKSGKSPKASSKKGETFEEAWDEVPDED